MSKRDKATNYGIFIGTLVIIIGMALDNGKLNWRGLALFWDLPSIFITVGGSFFTILICYPFETVKGLHKALRKAFAANGFSRREIIDRFVELSKKARKEGLLSLEDEVSSIDDEFLKNGIQMVVDGIEPETIREILELGISAMQKRHSEYINLLKSWAGYSPAYGMIGTLIGLTQMLANLNDPSSLGPGMSKAIITSFYGSVMANFIFGPLANKLEVKDSEEADMREMMLEGILSIQSGISPRIIEDKLITYLSPEEKIELMREELHGRVAMENE